MYSPFIVAVLAAVPGQTSPTAGSISGVVVNASLDGTPAGESEIVLRVMLDGQFVIAAEGVADEQGRFVFDNIPADREYVYLPGANHDGVHYPGSRIRLSSQLPHANVRLAIHNTINRPCPLVLRHHRISIKPETDAIRVTESLLIDNPTLQTFVGDPKQAGDRAATLRLAIPSNFRRTTFEGEFYGRQFTLFNEKLVTDIPWTPGKRELKFTYVLPREERNQSWQRPLDLPCDHLRIEVHTETPDEISCNIPLSSSPGAEKGVMIFESKGQQLPANHLIRVQLEAAPISLATHGRWLALAVLVGLIAAVSLLGIPLRLKNSKSLDHGQATTARKRAA